MNTKSWNYIRNMCRTCMAKFSKAAKEKAINNKQTIYGIPKNCTINASLMDLLQVVQPRIKVELNDNLPTLMCEHCIEKLLIAHEFIVMYQSVDKQYRNILKEIEINKTSRDNYEDETASNKSLQIVEINENSDEVFDEKKDDIYGMSQYEFKVQEINIEHLKKEEVNVNDWPEFEDEPLKCISEEVEVKKLYFTNPYSDAESEEKDLYFINPYSDASDNEWELNSGEKETPTNMITRNRKADNEVNVESKMGSASKKSPKKNGSNKGQETEKDNPTINENGSVACQECETAFDNEELWQEHVRCHRLGKIYKSKYTKKSNDTGKTTTKEKIYECEECGKGFTKRPSLRNHKRIHTGEQPFLCIECGKSFKVLSSLNIHMLRHKGDKRVQCPHCPKKFVCSSGLYGHMMVHTKEKPFVCDICGSAFHMGYQLRKHNLYHNNIKNYPCEHCDMRFVTAEKQRRHMRTHTGEKPYSCKYCVRAFAQSNDLMKHLRQHLGDNVYQCELCPLRFPLARELRVHFATHKDDNDETRARNLKDRLDEERSLQIKLCVK